MVTDFNPKSAAANRGVEENDVILEVQRRLALIMRQCRSRTIDSKARSAGAPGFVSNRECFLKAKLSSSLP
jgi:hypothetical protein